ncbi:uncharacterized protein LOC122091351 isoform X2 [Macadamia integrifolia]|uniref:uncharacterized protein LOC122091351 isoform X2 n=1 Tax=Macadamia integrifolia TaxID=60698 RepID=UPI001C4E322F|nr:uncharacterized protein LOC122091351 isoform X2 [Macadamia integrifolia]
MLALLSPRLSLPSIHNCYHSPSSSIRLRVSLPTGSRFRVLHRHCSESMSSSTVDAAGEASSLASDSGNAVGNTPDADVLVQYIVLRRDLIDSWPLGSIITQGCHASVSAIWSHKDDAHTLDYCSPENINSMHKATGRDLICATLLLKQAVHQLNLITSVTLLWLHWRLKENPRS